MGDWQFGSTNANPLNRGAVIDKICELELQACQLLKAEFRNRNEEYSESNVEKLIFGESGIAATLGKMALLLHNLGYIKKHDYEDLKKIYRIRCIYAHTPGRKMLSQEPDIYKYVRDCSWYHRFGKHIDHIDESYPEERTFIALCEYYRQLLARMGNK